MDAAVVLGLGQRTTVADQIAVDQRSLTIEDWRASHPRDFARACDAYLAAAQRQGAAAGAGSAGSSSGPSTTLLTAVLSLLIAVVTAIVGGMVTVCATFWVSGAERRRKLAKDLEAKARTFEEVGLGYVRSFRGDGPLQVPDDLFAAQAALDRVLQQAEAAHRYWRLVGVVRSELGAAPLADHLALDRDMNSPSRPIVDELAQRVEAAVRNRAMDALRLAVAIRTPVSSIRRLRAGTVSVLRTARQPDPAVADQAPGGR
ncbi:MAG: hypothetical protein JXA67_17800 [Micromonosporaceae bacterium]|nr:hypothetical protein [Micromonosporaceae bacterium]